VLARDNAHYSIPDRQYVTNVSKAQRLSQVDLSRIRDPYVRMSLELQRAFGLRREEALKLRPRDADRGDRLILKASWTKGGKAREILNRAQQLAGRGSLMPTDRSYIQHLSVHHGSAHPGVRRISARTTAALVMGSLWPFLASGCAPAIARAPAWSATAAERD
jgi:integrase